MSKMCCLYCKVSINRKNKNHNVICASCNGIAHKICAGLNSVSLAAINAKKEIWRCKFCGPQLNSQINLRNASVTSCQVLPTTKYDIPSNTEPNNEVVNI